MVTTHTFVDFSYDVLGFVWSEAPEVRHSITPYVQLIIDDRVFVGLIFYPSRIVLIFRDLSFSQIFKYWVDLAWRMINRHDVVDRILGTWLG